MLAKDTLTLLNKKTKELETYNVHTGELVASGTSLQGSSQIVFDLGIAEHICMLIREGNTLRTIATMEGMPSLHVILSWRSRHPDFAKAMKVAEYDRAAVFHDKAVAVLDADDYDSKDELNKAKFKFDGYLRLAEKGDPNKYAAKPTTVLAGGSAAPTIIVNTGIRRTPQHVEGDTYAEETTEDTDAGRIVQEVRAGDTTIQYREDDFGGAFAGGFGGIQGGVDEGFVDSTSSSYQEGSEEKGEEESNEGDEQW